MGSQASLRDQRRREQARPAACAATAIMGGVLKHQFPTAAAGPQGEGDFFLARDQGDEGELAVNFAQGAIRYFMFRPVVRRNAKSPSTEADGLNDEFWWEVQVSNLRPLQCECSALPLS
jgi:hypothetical protein